MTEFRIMNDQDFAEYIRMFSGAYPGLQIPPTMPKAEFDAIPGLNTLNAEPTTHFYGAHRDGKMVGGMRLHDFTMQVRSAKIPAGGIAVIAVDLAHKKEKIAKDIIEFFFQHYNKQNTNMVMLYSFRPDFYKQMGFGFGMKMNKYKIVASLVPKGPSKKHIVALSRDDKQAVLDCYNRYMENTNGLMNKTESELNAMFDGQIYGYKQGDQVLGYTVFSFVPAHESSVVQNDAYVTELIYETPEALSELLTFFNSQADQLRRIIFHTQDESFYHLFGDPRNESLNLISPFYHESNTAGVGIMYRVINTAGIFQDLATNNFGGQTYKLKLTIQDSLVPENNGSTIIHFESGIASVQAGGDFDVEVSLDVADFSSLLMGSISFKTLYNYGLATVSNRDYLEQIHQTFFTENKPLCLTTF